MNFRTKSQKVWKTIKTLSNQKTAQNTGATLIKGDKEIKTSEQKAREFIKEYAKVSNIQLNKEERSFERKVKMKLKEKCPCKSNEQTEREDHCSPFSIGELQQSINELKPDSAHGDDQITNSIIQHLSDLAKETLLNLFNESIDKDYFPSIWKKATITPLLKPGKDPKHFSSYRPICLTSCLGKVLERMVKNRLTHFLEKNNILCPEQAGFRRMRSTQDQVMKITQQVADGLNHRRPAKRTLLALIDFSRAFDTV